MDTRDQLTSRDTRRQFGALSFIRGGKTTPSPRSTDGPQGGDGPQDVIQAFFAGVGGVIVRFHNAYGIDRDRVSAAGYSNGGQMVFRLAAEMPERFAGLAAIAATQPTPDNCACEASGRPVPILLMSGTRDPIMPYTGGVISLFGFKPRGTALSAPETAKLLLLAERHAPISISMWAACYVRIPPFPVARDRRITGAKSAHGEAHTGPDRPTGNAWICTARSA